MLFEKTYGIDLGSSSVKVYSFFRNKTYIEKNRVQGTHDHCNGK